MNGIIEPSDDSIDVPAAEAALLIAPMIPAPARGITKEQLDAASRVLEHARATFPKPDAVEQPAPQA